MESKIRTLFIGAFLVGSFSGCVTNSTPRLARPMVPSNLEAPATEQVAFEFAAHGVQIYECRAKKDNPTQFEWALKAPEAELFDQNGTKVAHHFRGPTWEANDGSMVVGELKARADASRADSIPWLWLTATNHTGEGIFSKVTSIQRVDTAGGKAPAGGCEQTAAGNEIRVPYSATYYFYVAAQ
jgi:hypothetical protein